MLSAAFVVALASVAAPRAAKAVPLIVAGPARPGPIEITESSSYLLGSDTGGEDSVVCIVFVNHGPHTATKVGLNLAMVDELGKVVGIETLFPSGTFFVDKRSAFSGSRDTRIPNGNCHMIPTVGAAFGSTIRYPTARRDPFGHIAAILVSAREVVYDDGTSWRPDGLPQTGDHVTLPKPPPFRAEVADGPPVMTPGVASTPVEVIDAFAYESTTLVTSGRIPYEAHLRNQTCIVFVNHGPRTVTHVRFSVALADRAGTIVALQPLDAFGTFSADVAVERSREARHSIERRTCARLVGAWHGDSFLFTPKKGAPLPLGRVLVAPVSGEFADGMTWVNPDPPKPGYRVTPF